MKKTKQILAIIGIILLVLMYLLTLIAAIFEPANTMNYLLAAVITTIIVPIVIWAIGLFYKLLHKNGEIESPNDESNE